MAYELNLGIYATVWAGLLAVLITMASWIDDRSRELFEAFVNRIDRKNGDLGLDRSVNATEIALDLLLPFRGENTDRYVERNEIPREECIRELKNDGGWPTGLVLLLILSAMTAASAFSGPLVYYAGGGGLLAGYLMLLLGLTAANFVGYFLIRP